MKAVFKIYPIEKDNDDAHLLIEAGAESISFALYKKSPFEILGVLVYNLDKNLLPLDIAAAIDNIISNEPVLLQDFSSCIICSNFKESLLIESKFESIIKFLILIRLFDNVVSEFPSSLHFFNYLFNKFSV